MERLKGSGESIPWTEKEIADRLEKQNLLADEVFVDPAELVAEIKAAYPVQFKDLQVPTPEGSSKHAGEPGAKFARGGRKARDHARGRRPAHRRRAAEAERTARQGRPESSFTFSFGIARPTTRTWARTALG